MKKVSKGFIGRAGGGGGGAGGGGGGWCGGWVFESGLRWAFMEVNLIGAIE